MPKVKTKSKLNPAVEAEIAKDPDFLSKLSAQKIEVVGKSFLMKDIVIRNRFFGDFLVRINKSGEVYCAGGEHLCLSSADNPKIMRRLCTNSREHIIRNLLEEDIISALMYVKTILSSYSRNGYNMLSDLKYCKMHNVQHMRGYFEDSCIEYDKFLTDTKDITLYERCSGCGNIILNNLGVVKNRFFYCSSCK